MALASGAVSYIKNVSKSLMYSTADILKDNSPYLNSLFKESKDNVKDLYQSIKDFSSGKGAEIKSMGKEALDNVFKNLKDDLKSGNFYNKERDDVFDNEMMKMMGFDMEDMDFSFDDESFNLGSDTDDITDGDELILKQNAKNTAATIMAVDKVGAKVAEGVNQGTAASAKYIINSTRAMNTAMYSLNSKGFATITEAIATLNKNTIGMNEAIAKPLTSFMQNGTLFFTKTSESLDKLVNIGEEILRRIPSTQSSKSNSSRRDKTFSGMLSGDDFSISSYKDFVTGNVKEYTDMFSSLLGMVGGGKNLGSLAKGVSPLRFITKAFMGSVLPTTFTVALKSFDNALKDFIPSMLAKGANGKSNSLIGSILREIFLPQNKIKRNVSTNYNRGPIPFDGETKKAITDVIPKYLAYILSAINGSEPQFYDYKKGSFISRSATGNIKAERERKYAEEAGGDLRKDAMQVATSKRDKDAIDRYFLEAFLSGEDITALNRLGYTGEKNTAFSKMPNSAKRALRQTLRSGKGKYNKIPANMLRGRDRLSKEVEELAGISPEIALFDGSIALGGKSKIGSAIGGVDKYGNSMYDYLRGIYINTLSGIGGGEGSATRKSIKGLNVLVPMKDIPTKSRNISKYNEASDQDDEKYNLKLDAKLKSLKAKINKASKNLKNAKDDTSTELTKAEIEALEKEFENTKGNYKGLSEGQVNARVATITGSQDFLDKIDSKLEETSGSIRGFLKKFIPDPIINLLNKPINAVSKLLNTLTDSMNSFLWGDGTKDGVFAQIGKKLTENSKISKLLDTILGEKDKDGKRTGFWNQTKESLKEYWNWIKSGYNEKWDATKPGSGKYVDINPPAANGRRITKTGMIAVSEGELVIPAEFNPFYRKHINKNEQYRKESNAMRRFYGFYGDGGTAQEGSIGYTLNNAFREAGNILWGIPKGIYGYAGKEFGKHKEDIDNMLGNFKNDFKVARGRVGSGAIVGAGIGGVLGSPILGALVGSVAGFVSKSESAQKALFGEYDEEKGGYQGGLFSKSLSNFLTQNAPEMVRGGTIGLLGGSLLVGGPVGAVGGLIAGSALGFARKSKGVQEFLFGKINEKGEYERGLFNKEKWQKALPKVIIGAGAGLLFGPTGGLFTNMVLGAGLGFIASNQKVHDFLFGSEKDGKKKQGLLNKVADRLFGGITDLFANTTNYLKTTITNIGKNIITKVGNIREWFAKRKARKKAMDEANPTLLRKIGKVGGKVLKGAAFLPFLAPFLPAAALAGGAIWAPRAIANSQIRRHLRKGYNVFNKKEGRNMTAAERMEYRDQHKFTGDDDKWDDFDRSIASKDIKELEEIQSVLSADDINNRRMKQFADKQMESFYNSANGFDQIDTAQLSKLSKLIEKGDTTKVEALMTEEYGISKDSDVYKNAINASKNISKKKSDNAKLQKSLKTQFGIKNAKDLTKAQDLIKAELKSKSPDQITAENTGSIFDLLKDFSENGIKLRANKSEKEGTYRDKNGRLRDKATGRFVKENKDNTTTSTESESEASTDSNNIDDSQGTVAEKKRGFKYYLNSAGESVKLLWNKTKAKWSPDLHDKDTKKNIDDAQASEEANQKSTSILDRVKSGIFELKDGLIGNIKDKAKGFGGSIFEKIKNIGKKLLFAGGIIAGIKLAPNLLPLLGNMISWTVENAPKILSRIVGIGEVLTKIASKILKRDTSDKVSSNSGKDIVKGSDRSYRYSDTGKLVDGSDITVKGGDKSVASTIRTSLARSTGYGVSRGLIASGKALKAGTDSAGKIIASNIGKSVKGSTVGSVQRAYQVTKAIKHPVQTISKAAKALKDLLAKLFKKLPSFGGKKISTEAAEKAAKEIAEEAAEKGAKKVAGNTASKAAKFVPIAGWAITAAIFIGDFTTGWQNAASTFGIIDEPTLGQKAISGLLKAVKGLSFICSLIPDDILIDIFCDVLFKDWDFVQDLREQRARAQEIVDQYNAENGTNLTVEQYNKQVLGRYTWTESIANAFKTKSQARKQNKAIAAGKGSGLYSYYSGSGAFVSQLDSRYASKSYGNSTVAKNGCAPAVASMIASAKGKNLPMEEAIKIGQKYTNPYGTSINYFSDALGKKGIKASYAGKEKIIKDLQQGNPLILLGRNLLNRSKAVSPFGPNNHYVMATGFDNNGRIIISDPEANTIKSYNPSILASTIKAMSISGGTPMGVVTGTQGLSLLGAKIAANNTVKEINNKMGKEGAEAALEKSNVDNANNSSGNFLDALTNIFDFNQFTNLISEKLEAVKNLDFSTKMGSKLNVQDTIKDLNLKPVGSGTNAYYNLIETANKYRASGAGIKRTNNIIVNGKGSNDTMLEQLVAAILEVLTKIVDIDIKDSTNIELIKNNSTNLNTITNLLSKYSKYKAAKEKQQSSSSVEIDSEFKAVVEQVAALAKG